MRYFDKLISLKTKCLDYFRDFIEIVLLCGFIIIERALLNNEIYSIASFSLKVFLEPVQFLEECSD